MYNNSRHVDKFSASAPNLLGGGGVERHLLAGRRLLFKFLPTMVVPSGVVKWTSVKPSIQQTQDQKSYSLTICIDAHL